MNNRQAKKILKRVNERLVRENFGPLTDREAKGPDYSRDQVYNAYHRCRVRRIRSKRAKE